MKNTLCIIIILFLAGCNFSNNNEPTPTVEPLTPQIVASATFTPSPSPSPSATPFPTLEPPVVIFSTATPTPAPLPTNIPLPTDTPSPWEYTIQEGDTLGFIIQQEPFNYRTFDVIQEIVRINDNIPSADQLPPPGSVILIPRPTATPVSATTPQPNTNQANVSGNAPGAPTVVVDWSRLQANLPPNQEFGCHIVQENDRMVGIAERYDGMNLAILSQLNPDLYWTGCNFDLPSGGPNCNPLIIPDTCIIILLPTATPSPSPTPSGLETSTPTPTPLAPSLVAPPNGGSVSGRVVLQWVSVGVLPTEQRYLVQLFNTANNELIWAGVTEHVFIEVPVNRLPAEVTTIEWSVTVASPTEQGYIPVGGTASRTFNWLGR
ncbi:MAG: hypothetical protein Kow00117_12420 [Phototrophicales bacterium]